MNWRAYSWVFGIICGKNILNIREMRKTTRSYKQKGGGGGSCPTGFICSDTTTVWLVAGVALLVIVYFWAFRDTVPIVVQMPAAPTPTLTPVAPTVFTAAFAPQGPQIRPDIYPEPVQRLSLGIPGLRTRTTAGPITQVGIITAEGGSSGSAAPDRTILPLYGRELDARRGRWNYYTRTDGANPVQVPVRVGNRVCDDDTNGCDEIGSDDSIHVPALGRAFTATVYKKSIF